MIDRVSVWLSLTLMVTACGSQPEPAANTANAVQWPAVRDEIVEGYLKSHPNFAVVQGRHEYDGQLPDWSAEGIAAEIKRLHAAKNRLTAVPESAVEGPARLERDILIQRMDRDLFWLETAEAPFVNPAFYFDWIVDNLDPSPYLTRTYAPLEMRMRAYTKYAQSVQTAAKQIRANLRTPLSLPLLERGISGFKGFADFFKADVPAIFASIQDPSAQAAFKDANTGAATAMADLAAWLESQRASATASFALGPEKFAKMLNDTERVTTPLAELEAAGRADLERNQAALKEACATFAPGASVPASIEKMSANKPKGGAVAGARAQLAELKQFVQDAGVATIPSPEDALVNEAPPYNRANFAYIDIPGPYEKNSSAIYYIAPPDPSWPPKEQRDYLPGQADLLFTSVHEVWPGHFLQFLHSNRNESIVGRLFVGYAFAEGWAHYAEETMWDMGLGHGSAETHIGQLEQRPACANARFLSANRSPHRTA
jgi:hypothetical protein